MSMNDPISDMITRIRNGQLAKKNKVGMPSSNLKTSIAQVLKDEGYIDGYSVDNLDGNKKSLNIELKYYAGEPVIEKIVRVTHS